MKIALEPANYETSIAGWSFALCDALDSYGLDGREVFRAAGLDLDTVTSADARLPVSRVQKVWQYAAEHTDEYFGAEVSRFLTPASLHALGFGLWCSSSLRDYFERYIRYRCVLSHMHFCELVEGEDACTLYLVDERKIKSEITQDAAMGFFIRMARTICDPDFTPREVHVKRVLAKGAERLQEFCGTEVKGGSGAHAIILDREVLDRPLRFANPALAAKQDAIVERYIAEWGLISEYMLRVRTTIQDQLSSGTLSVEAVAEAIGVTVRTLQRRLADENSSYNQLLDDVRKQMALDYARDPALNATEIAFNLGFTDSGSFGRCFKRWTKQSFTDYRRQRIRG